MHDREQKRRVGGLGESSRQPALPVRNTLSSRQLPIPAPSWVTNSTELEIQTSSCVFRLPSPTSSDEADIEAQEKLLSDLARPISPHSSSGIRSPESDQLA